MVLYSKTRIKGNIMHENTVEKEKETEISYHNIHPNHCRCLG